MQRFGFAHFKGIGATPVHIDLTKKATILIGPNNAGKSSILEGFEMLTGLDRPYKPLADESRHGLTGQESPTIYIELEWSDEGWASRNFSKATVVFDNAGKKIADNPIERIDHSTLRQLCNSVIGAELPNYLKMDMAKKFAAEVVMRMVRDTSPFRQNPVRSIPAFRRVGASEHDPTISNIAKTLGNWRDPAMGKKDDRKKFEAVQRFVRHLMNMPDGIIELPREEADVHIFDGNIELPLRNHGAGITQVLYFAVHVLQYDNSYFTIEEPEVYLHPRLQKELVRFLLEQTTNQYVISTHSPSLLNATSKHDVIRVWREGNETRAEKVNKTTEAMAVLRDLGLSAADLMQARFAIWIEGPSDAIYLRRWIDIAQADIPADERVFEDIDYTFVFYGGKCLSHLTFDRGESNENAECDAEAAKLVAALKVNQNAAMIIDSDKHNESWNIWSVKLRVESECKAEGVMCWITQGREIENYLDAEAVEATFREDGANVDLPAVDRWLKIEEQIRSGIPSTSWRPKWDYADRKPHWASRIAPKLSSLDCMDLQERMTELLRRIRSAG